MENDGDSKLLYLMGLRSFKNFKFLLALLQLEVFENPVHFQEIDDSLVAILVTIWNSELTAQFFKQKCHYVDETLMIRRVMW